MSNIDEVVDVERFRPKGATLDYLNEVDESVREIDSYRPIQSDIMEKLQNEILYDRVHASAVIEGNSLSRRETIVVLSSGVVEAGSRKDSKEVINLADCCMYLQERLDAGDDLSVMLIKELHQKLMAGIDDDSAGRFRNVDVAISGAKVSPPSFLEVPSLIEKLIEVANAFDGNLMQKAAWLHWAFARIHPFEDGNGRMARLLQDYVLLRGRYVPSTVQPEDRERNYYETLEQADLGDGTAFLEIVAKNTLRTAERYLAIIREEKARTDWVQNIAKAATEKVKNSEHRQFVSLQRAYDEIKFEFANLSKELSKRLPDGFLGFRDYGSLDFDKYQSLKSRGRASRTWLFGLHIKNGDLDQRFIFWYAMHHVRPDDVEDFSHGTLALLVSMQDSAGNYQKLDDVGEDRITLREIVSRNREYLRRRYNPVSDCCEWDADVLPSQISREFLQEVLAKVGLI